MLVFRTFTNKSQMHQDSKTEKYNMAKFTCLVLCAATVSLNSVYADEPSGPYHNDVNTILLECAIEYGVTDDNMRTVMRTQDTTIVNPCFWDCILKKIGFFNEKGEYDIKTGMTYVKKYSVLREDDYAMLELVAKECESEKDTPVKDEAGCERGALVAACFAKQIETHKK